MTGVLDPQSGRRLSDEELAWASSHLSELRRSVSERRIRRQLLWGGLVLGLAVHVAGFLLKSPATGGPIGVLADLLYALGLALWTGVVVAAVVESINASRVRSVRR